MFFPTKEDGCHSQLWLRTLGLSVILTMLTIGNNHEKDLISLQETLKDTPITVSNDLKILLSTKAIEVTLG